MRLAPIAVAVCLVACGSTSASNSPLANDSGATPIGTDAKVTLQTVGGLRIGFVGYGAPGADDALGAIRPRTSYAFDKLSRLQRLEPLARLLQPSHRSYAA